MTWLPGEIEQILREQWDDAEMFGGFEDRNQAARARNELQDIHGSDAIQDFLVLGQVGWATYEESCQYTLLLRLSDDSLMLHRDGYSVYGGQFGDDFLGELESTTIEEWIESVEACEQHAREFSF